MTTRNGQRPLPESSRTCPDQGIAEKIPNRVISLQLFARSDGGAALEQPRRGYLRRSANSRNSVGLRSDTAQKVIPDSFQ